MEDAELDFKSEPLREGQGRDFSDVEVFLSEYGLGPSEEDPRDSSEVAFDEEEVPEVLASYLEGT